MVKNPSSTWWIPLARRVAVWGLVMAALWSAIAIVFCVLPVVCEIWLGLTDDQEFNYWHIHTVVSTSFFPLAACFIVAGGFIAGGFSGFYALPTESRSPLHSQFFRSVCKDTFVGWLISTCILTVTVVSFLLFFSARFSDDYGLALLIFIVMLFALSLWRAINRALRSPKNPLL